MGVLADAAASIPSLKDDKENGERAYKGGRLLAMLASQMEPWLKYALAKLMQCVYDRPDMQTDTNLPTQPTNLPVALHRSCLN